MGDQYHLRVDQAVESQSCRQSIRIRLDRNARVDLLFVELVEDILGRRGQDVQLYAGKIILEVCEHARNEDLRHARAHADRQRVQQRAAQPTSGIGETEQIAHHALGLVQKGAAAIGGFDPTRGSAKQFEADFLSEQLDLLADV